MARDLYDEPINKPYRKLEADDMPIIEVLEKIDYQELLIKYQAKHGKELKPVVRRKKVKQKYLKTWKSYLYPGTALFCVT